MTYILALDLATTTGWARGHSDALPAFGHWRLPSPVRMDRGPLFSKFRVRLLEALVDVRREGGRVIYEAPILPKAFLKAGRIIYPTNIETTTLLQGLAAIVEVESHDAGVQVQMTDVGTVKMQLAGTGKADKADMVAAARKMGCEVVVHDEADAIGVWLVGVRHYAPRDLVRFDQVLYGPKRARAGALK